MASLPTRTTSSFDAIKPVTSLVPLDNEFNQYVGASGIFNGGTTATKLLVKTSDATDPPCDEDQVGAGLLARWKQNGTAKITIANNGQIVSAISTGTAPISVTSTTTCTNLDADSVDGIQGSNIAKLDTHKTAFEVSWFYPVLPSAVETNESVPRFIVPPGVAITIIDIGVVWVAGADSNASNIFTIKRRNNAGTLQTDVGTIDVNTNAANVPAFNNISDLPLSETDQIYPLFTTRNTASEQLVTVFIRGTQKFTT